MVSVLVCGTLLYLHVASGDRYLRKLFSRVSYPKNVIIEIPTTIEGNLEARYLGISPNFTSQEAIDWWEKHEPHYQKFVTEQIRLEEEAKAKQPPRTPPNTEEILASLGDWGHYYDYKTKEIISWERRNPPAINQMPLIDHYKELKAMALEKQRLRALNRTTDFYPGMKDQMAKMKEWLAEEIKAGRIVCQCDNRTGPTKFTERYTLPPDKVAGKWEDGMFSLEKE